MFDVAKVSQAPEELDLEWTEFDPFSMQWIARGVDWHGTYKAQVRTQGSLDGTVICPLDVTAEYVAPDTVFVAALDLETSRTVATGNYFWSVLDTEGPTRFAGKAFVRPSVTARDA